MKETGSTRRQLIFATVVVNAPFLVNGYINEKLFNWPPVFWTFEVLIRVALPVSFLVYLLRGGMRAGDIGFTVVIWGRRSLLLVGLGFLIYAFLYYWMVIASYEIARRYLPDVAVFDYESAIPRVEPFRTLVSAYYALGAAFTEEIFSRALLYRIATMFRRTVLIYLTVSPIVFAIGHWESGWAITVSTYVLGVFAAMIYMWMKNIWPLIVVHFVDDFVQLST